MMFYLILDIANGFSNMRDTDRERSVTRQPSKLPWWAKGFMRPSRGSAFDQLPRFSDRQSNGCMITTHLRISVGFCSSFVFW